MIPAPDSKITQQENDYQVASDVNALKTPERNQNNYENTCHISIRKNSSKSTTKKNEISTNNCLNTTKLRITKSKSTVKRKGWQKNN